MTVLLIVTLIVSSLALGSIGTLLFRRDWAYRPPAHLTPQLLEFLMSPDFSAALNAIRDAFAQKDAALEAAVAAAKAESAQEIADDLSAVQALAAEVAPAT